MATRVTDSPRFARVAASLLPRECIALSKSKEKERLLAVYTGKRALSSIPVLLGPEKFSFLQTGEILFSFCNLRLQCKIDKFLS